MFGKSGFILRALFATFFVGSLVACTFDMEGVDDEEKGTATSEVGKGKNPGADAAIDPEDVDGGPWDGDGGPWDGDGGPYDHDGGPYGHDGGPYGHDGGDAGWSDGGDAGWSDGGAWGDAGKDGGKDAGGGW